jgi:glycosyltransferase involved in cell wall biosynthesis
VIPTARRAHLVPRAVRSALAQSLADIEVIVVIDGPDQATRDALSRFDDPRLRLVQLPENVGLGGAINAGVREAASPWIALLDDDDEWFPRKLEMQLPVAERSTHPYPVVSCRLIARSEAGDVVWPLRYPDPGEHPSEYLFCQRGLRGGEGVLLPSTLLVAKALAERVPCRTGLPMRNDVDWLLRAAERCGIRPEFVPEREPLAVWHMETGRARIGNSADWRWSLNWIRENRALVTRRAYAGYLLTSVGMTAAQGRQWNAFGRILWEAFRGGRPGGAELGAYVLIWAIPKPVRNRMTVALTRRATSKREKARRDDTFSEGLR